MRKYLILVIIMFFTSLYTSLFIIQEGQRGLVLRFGKVLRDNYGKTLIYNPGLHIKIPFIENVKYLDARMQTMENQADRFVTIEKKDLIVDSYVKWRISDFSRYYLATNGGDILQAEIILKRRFFDRLRSELGRLNVKNIITDYRNSLMTDVLKALNNGTFSKNKDIQPSNAINHSVILSTTTFLNNKKNNLSSSINLNNMSALGIEVVDVRIKQINLPIEVYNAIYKRMRAEREAVAKYHRSQGQEEAEKLRAIADYHVIHILSEAKRKALIFRGEADAETVKLYANYFSKYPKFYVFMRSMNAYKNSFNNSNNNLMVISPESYFFRFMKIPRNMLSSKMNS